MSENDNKPFQEMLEQHYQQERQNHVASPDLRQKLMALSLQQEEPEEEPVVSWGQLFYWPWLAPVVAASVVLFLFWGPLSQQGRSPSTFVPKGISWSVLYAHAKSVKAKGLLTNKASNGTILYPNDIIQFTYHVPTQMHVMLAGLNQKGESYLMVHGPGKNSVLVAPKGGVFPRQGNKVKSFQLDDYIGLERFVFVASVQPFSWETLKPLIHKAWLKHNKDLKEFHLTSKTWLIRSIWIQKKKTSLPKN